MSELTRRSFLSAAAAAPVLASLARASNSAADTPGDAHRGPCSIASFNGLRSVSRAMDLIAQGYDPADAVVQGVKIIEDDPEDDSVGIGGLPNEEGVVELDASVMHGPTHKSGAVAGIRNIKNPASVALLVLRRTNHCLLVGDGARRFAVQMGFREEDLLTEKARQEWLAWKANMSKHDDWIDDDLRDAPTGKTWDLLPWQHPDAARPGGGGQNDGAQLPKKQTLARPFRADVTGTVHCSALAPRGDLASTTSTSGLNWKIPGRVGDSPIIGAGNYCDNDVGAAGCTGRGEAAIVNLAAFSIVSLMRDGKSPSEACLEVAKRVVDHNKEKRHRTPDGRPDFNVRFYALRKDGAYASASIYSGGKFAVHDSTGPKTLDAMFLYDGKP